ncbi:MAG: hypothetical protein ABJB40_06240 [Acidobacteriota bacterium]
MNFEIIISVEDEFLRITTVGKYSFEDLFEFLDRVKLEADRANRNNVLIDSLRAEGNITEAERFQGGQRIAQIFGSRIKLAWLMPAERITKLGELAAVNRGAKFLVTHSEAEAVKWLKDNSGVTIPKSHSQVL